VSGKIINGTITAKTIRNKIKEEVEEFYKKNNKVPKLTVILVGNDPASLSYIKGKKNGCKKVGIDFELLQLPEETKESELINLIDKLNSDKNTNGILVQLPLPKDISEDKIIESIVPEKDVDGFHPVNIGRMIAGIDSFLPCTPYGIIKLLKENNINIEGKNAVVVGRSNIVGKPISFLLLKENATVTICHSKTKDLKEKCLQGDILVAAVGKPKMITDDMVKDGAVVIDVGINRVGEKLYGDVDYEKVKEVAGFITPVPGGVGPMTITMLLENTLKAAKLQNTGGF